MTDTSPSEIITRSPFSDLLNNAVLLLYSVHKFGIRRKIETSSFPITADASLIGVTKRILDCPEYQAITRLDNQTRRRIFHIALPSSLCKGMALVPAKLVHELDDLLTKYQSQRESLVKTFCDVYPLRTQEALLRLGTYFKTDDYPPVEDVKKEFAVSCQYLSFDLPSVLETINAQVFAREKAQAASKVSEMIQEIQNTLRAAMRDLVTHLVTRLTPDPLGQRKTFRASTVTNLMDFLNRFDARNLGQDDELHELVKQSKKLLNGVTATTLKQNETLSVSIRKGLDDIKTQLDQLLINPPSRLITLEDDGEDTEQEPRSPQSAMAS
ncbi:MAG: hypothetical protein NPIRA04_04070 [Nitrospirales bacterium]|nr:MAG: hypothetical protein NPIRA04_04070 [Nitrospirales bacterium]